MKTFKTIKPPPMSNRIPASDAEIARKLAKFSEDIHLLESHGSEYVSNEQAKRAANGVRVEMNAFLANHNREQAEFDEWLRAGKPDLDEAGKPIGRTT